MTDTPQHAAVATQVAAPWRASLRTGVASLISLLLALPAITAIISEVLGAYLPENALAILATVALAGAGVATCLNRIALIPAVNDLLTKAGLGPVSKSAAQVADTSSDVEETDDGDQ